MNAEESPSDSVTRRRHFREAIAGFIDERRALKLKAGDDPDTASKFDYPLWLADAARRVSQIQAVTHVLKATHPDARGSSLHVAPASLPGHAEIGSHDLGDDYAQDVVGNAAALDVFKLLKIEIDGKRLLDWMQAGDVDLQAALSDDAEQANAWMQAFASMVRTDARPASHALAKQLYWLIGDEPQDDAQYQLLQPMFSSSLAHVVHAEIDDARFGEINKAARQAFREKTPSAEAYRNYVGLAVRKLGGTKPQNISQLNSERRGMNYLLASLPPPAWEQRRSLNLLGPETVLPAFFRFGGVRDLVRKLTRFLREDPDRSARTRSYREAVEQAIGQELAMFGVEIRVGYPAGWTRDPRCRLPRCEQLWLDPDRVELADREDPEHPQWLADDQTFRAEYDWGDWPNEVAERFGRWLNQRLRDGGAPTTLAEPEMRHWSRQAILDVAWPVPHQRRAQRVTS